MRPARSQPSPARGCWQVWGALGWKDPAPWPGMLHAGGWGWQGPSPGFWGCNPKPTFTGQFGTRALHRAPPSPVPISGSDTGAAQGCLGTPPSGSFRADKLSWWGIAAPAPLFAVGLIFLFVRALRTGSGSQGLRGGNRRIRCFRGSSATTAGDEPARRAGMRDAASHGARPQQSTRRGLLPAKETLNSGCLHPSKTSFIWRLFLLLSPLRQVWGSETGRDGGDGRMQDSPAARRLWLQEPLALHVAKSCQARGRGIQKSMLNIITGLRFGSASQPVTLPSPSFALRAYSQDARAGGERQRGHFGERLQVPSRFHATVSPPVCWGWLPSSLLC